MRLATRLVLGTFTIVLVTILILAWSLNQGIPVVVGIALAISLVLAWLAGRSIAQPLVALSEAARDIAAGATPRFPRSGIPEVDALVGALRRLHRDLADRVVELQHEKVGGNAVVNAMVEGVIASDGRGTIVTANPAARRLLGYGVDARLPELPALFRDKAAREAVTRVLAGDEVNDCEFDRDGTVITINARPLPGRGAVLVLHDLTEVRRLEAVRRDFVANVSHELKTPLTSIAGYADTLTDSTIDPDTRQRFLATIINNARRMQRLVDDLLDLSRIESGRWIPRPQRIDVSLAIHDAWAPFRDRAEGREVELAVDVSADAGRVWADPEALRQILANLVDNALRYVPAGGKIRCSSVRSNGGVTLSVADNGSGIASNHLPRVFERFYRVDPARSRDEGGTGLGLAIVRHLVEAHGGSVHAESELQVGTMVRCWFPDDADAES
ncbi:MAG TPA: ATP-binding protein [Gemmatimonadales bacterium]